MKDYNASVNVKFPAVDDDDAERLMKAVIRQVNELYGYLEVKLTVDRVTQLQNRD